MAKKNQKKHGRTIEWNIFMAFTAILVVWMLIGFPFMSGITDMYGSMVSYTIYLLVIGLSGFLLGNTFEKGAQSLLLFISTIISVDIIFPPYIISLAEVPSGELLTLWGSDVFIYSIASGVLGLPHMFAWGATYILTPMAGILIMLYFLSGKRLQSKLMVIFNGS